MPHFIVNPGYDWVDEPLEMRVVMLNRDREHAIVEKLRKLPPERLVEVEDFVDFLRSRAEEAGLVSAASALSEGALRAVWDNPDDADYDRL